MSRIIRKIFIIGFSLLLFLIIVIGLVGVINLQRVNCTWETARSQGMKAIELVDDFDINLLRARREEKNFLLRYKSMGVKPARKEYITAFTDYLNQSEAAINKLKVIETLVKDATNLERIEKLFSLIDDYKNKFFANIDKLEQGSGGEKFVEWLISPQADQEESALAVKVLALQLMDEGYRMANEKILNAHLIEKNADITMILLIVIVLSIGILIAVFTFKLAFQSIDSLSEKLSGMKCLARRCPWRQVWPL